MGTYAARGPDIEGWMHLRGMMRNGNRRRGRRGISAAIVAGILTSVFGGQMVVFADDLGIPTSTVIEAHDPFGINSGENVSATVTPIPTSGSVTFELRVHGTSTIISQDVGAVNDSGHANGHLETTTYPGTFDLVASFAGPTYAPSSATEVLDIPPFQTWSTLVMTPTSPTLGQAISLTVRVAYDWVVPGEESEGTVEFTASKGGVEQSLGTVAVAPLEYHVGTASLAIPAGLALGNWTIVARYSGTISRAASESPPMDMTVSPVGSTVDLFGPGFTEAHHPIVLMAAIGAASYSWSDAATLTFGPVSGTGPGCSMAVSPLNAQTCTITNLPVGDYTYHAIYSGNTTVSGSTSNELSFTVMPDTLAATNVGIAYTTFYPYKDAYKDTLSISGTRNEAISAAIRIYAPTGKLVRSATVAFGTGKYAYSWNGRTASGLMLAGGKYKVVQTLRDTSGTQRIVTSYVTLSHKRLYTYTTYVNRSISQATARSKSAISWDFLVPSATVYKSLYLQIYGRSTVVPGAEYGAYDIRPCDGESGPGCIRTWYGMGWTNNWWSHSVSPTYNRSGRHVDGTVEAFGTGVVYKARVKVTYGLLK